MPSAPIPSNESSRLETLQRYSILDTIVEQEFEDATALASFICGTPIAMVSLIDRDRQWFKSKVGVDVQETPRSESFCAYTLTEPGTLIVNDASRDPRFADNPLVLANPKIRFYAGAPLVAPNGHILGTVCVIDTQPHELSTEQIKALEALSRQVMALIESRSLLVENKKAAAALMQSEKLAAVGRIAASMAHEINNPLEAITNLLFLSRLGAKTPEVQAWLDMADMEVRRISVVANHALRFHKQSSKPQRVTCLSLFSATLELYESRLNNQSIVVEKRKRANQPVLCFEGDIRHVLSNLITNSIDAMPTGGRLLVRSRHATDWRTGGKGVVLTLADKGSGIDPKLRSRLFEPFFTTKGINGSGLGLWISSEIMKRHQGRISIRSSQVDGHRGTVVCLFLPIAADETDALG